MTRSKRIRQVTPITELATRCSFCGKPHSESATVIAGPGVYICDTCVSLCHRLITEPAPHPCEHAAPDDPSTGRRGGADDDGVGAEVGEGAAERAGGGRVEDAEGRHEEGTRGRQEEGTGGETDGQIDGWRDGRAGRGVAGRVRRVQLGPDPDADEWISGMSDEDLLAALPRQALTVEQAECDLRAWVRVLRDRDVTWARIGEALGISRQAAWDRFAADIDAT
ncbi:hypothetical protein Ssi03_18600 [Sphaerisporangium siamense]|uniref:ClpX-type ZB domain-containing protein n=1 Tax=Sphaerisporangium siamense TaxID=795645 RepID=A0A7W7DEK9_9ACTN|nr:ClpX C4-type zinc finger protein [Sphaerisporangium siamense]MBB4705064.1 hypothetical protein [Sphaerisporangium siamense]GII83870.1 hypothetical protein Ssi03_18600 [Sphaerisporangium siamense]